MAISATNLCVLQCINLIFRLILFNIFILYTKSSYVCTFHNKEITEMKLFYDLMYYDKSR